MQRFTLVSFFTALIDRSLIVAVLLCCSAHAADFTPSALIEKSGLGIHLDFMPRSMKIGLGHSLKNASVNLSTEQIRDIHAVFDRAYAPPKLRAMVAERISARISAEQGNRMIAFLDSPLGKRVVEREARLAQPRIQAEIQENAAQIIAEVGANTSRLALYSSLDQAMESTRRAVATYIGSMLANNAAIILKTPDAPSKPTLQQIRKELEAQRFAITAAMSQAMLSNTAYAYKDLSESELNSYLRFALSPEGKAYFKELGDILAEVLVECAFDAGKFSAEQKQTPI